jgi:mannose-6-phosphate isomerase-like protein (cupin superfamily)
MDPWATQDVGLRYDRLSPSGTTEIRLLPNLPRGEIVHATTRPYRVSAPATLDGLTEFFFVLDGHGELWRGDDHIDEVTELLPGRCVMMPERTLFQYRTGSQHLEFLVITAPRFEPARWSPASRGRWSADEIGLGSAAGTKPQSSWMADLHETIGRPAPDGSEIRPLLECEDGGFAHCTLKQGACAKAIKHRTVDEIWFVLGGRGKIWRKNEAGQTAEDPLRPGRCITIPVGTSFQFRSEADSPLRIGIGTFPKWPGEDEALMVVGPWAQNPP